MGLSFDCTLSLKCLLRRQDTAAAVCVASGPDWQDARLRIHHQHIGQLVRPVVVPRRQRRLHRDVGQHAGMRLTCRIIATQLLL